MTTLFLFLLLDILNGFTVESVSDTICTSGLAELRYLWTGGVAVPVDWPSCGTCGLAELRYLWTGGGTVQVAWRRYGTSGLVEVQYKWTGVGVVQLDWWRYGTIGQHGGGTVQVNW